MNDLSTPLDEFFQRHRDQGSPLVLATIVHTEGSTYRKAGAQMLMAPDGSAAGLLSGGCLEADLLERARQVLASGEAQIVEYDTRTSDDLIWGIGLGCEGAMRILLTPLDAQNGYEPFAYAHACRARHQPGAFALTIRSAGRHALGACHVPGRTADTPSAVLEAMQGARSGQGRDAHGAVEVDADDARFLIVPVRLPPRIVILGAGPDVAPLVEIGGLLGWQITVLDHRPAYTVAARFPRAQRVALNPADRLAGELEREDFDAAVVMSHHLPSDLAYLEALSSSAIPYIGLLGPAARRMRLLSDLGERAAALEGRLRGPVGLDIGADTPESIALAIVSEIQAVLAGRTGGPLSTPAAPPAAG